MLSDFDEKPEIFNFKNENICSKIFLIISIVSWATFIITGYIGLGKLIIKKYIDGISYNNIWSFMNIYIKDESNKWVETLEEEGSKFYSYFPLQTHRGFYIFLFLILLLLATAGFVFFMIKLFKNKDYAVYEGMLGRVSRFHFIPLLLASAMFIIGISQKISFKDIIQAIHIKDFELFPDLLMNMKIKLLNFVLVMWLI